MEDSVTVITLTRGRTSLLERAVTSVQKQDYRGPVTHSIIVDDCESTVAYLKQSGKSLPAINWQLITRKPEETSGPSRLSKLRNLGVGEAGTKWISFLDDDNEFEPNHLSSLVECAVSNGCHAVHSYRQLYWPDGSPYLEEAWPWCRNVTDGKRAYKDLVAKGVFQPGSNIERDRCDSLDCSDPVRIVDTSEWLLAKSVLVTYPFCTDFSYQDWLDLTTEDDKLLQTLVAARVRIMCTRKATLKYYLGGYSNSCSVNRFTGSH